MFRNSKTQIQAHACTNCTRRGASVLRWLEHSWFIRCLVFVPMWAPTTHTHTQAHRHTPSLFLCSSPTPRLWKVHHTSDLRESHPKSFLWIIEEHQASLTLIILQSICLSSPPITSSPSNDRSNQSEKPLQPEIQSIVLHCLHWRCLVRVIGVFVLRTGVIPDSLRCSSVFSLSEMCQR